MPMQSFIVSFLLPLVSTLLFSLIGGVLSHLNSSTHRFPRFPLRNLYSLVTCSVLSCLRCNGHSLLSNSYFSRIGSIDNPSCTVQQRTLCAACSLATLCLSTTSGPGPGGCPASGAPWSSTMPPFLERGR